VGNGKRTEARGELAMQPIVVQEEPCTGEAFGLAEIQPSMPSAHGTIDDHSKIGKKKA